MPIERALRPACRLLFPERASALRPAPAAEISPEPTRVASGAALQVIPLPTSAGEVDSQLRAYVAEIPDATICSIGVRPELLGYAGPQVHRVASRRIRFSRQSRVRRLRRVRQGSSILTGIARRVSCEGSTRRHCP